jgi:23S rRNA (guanosine2251-2'-O)-methyltransferase
MRPWQKRHQGVVAIIKPRQGTTALTERDLTDFLACVTCPLVLVLDGVTDPHNLGACLRSADAAGVAVVVVPKDNSAELNAVARKVASGAAEVIPLVRVTNLA